MSGEVTRIIAAVEPTICNTWGSKGETIEGRILKDDFWILVGLARKAEDPSKLSIADAIKAIEAIDQYDGCEKLGFEDPETGARECSNRGDCLCNERAEAIEKAVEKLKGMIK